MNAPRNFSINDSLSDAQSGTSQGSLRNAAGALNRQNHGIQKNERSRLRGVIWQLISAGTPKWSSRHTSDSTSPIWTVAAQHSLTS